MIRTMMTGKTGLSGIPGRCGNTMTRDIWIQRR